MQKNEREPLATVKIQMKNYTEINTPIRQMIKKAKNCRKNISTDFSNPINFFMIL